MNNRLKNIVLIITALVLHITLANAYNNVNVGANTHVYFDNSAANWSYSHTYLVIGNDNQIANLVELTPITNTKLYYAHPDQYNQMDYICIYASETYAKPGTYDSLQANGANITLSENNYNFNSNEFYFLKPETTGSSSSPSAISPGYFGNTYTSLNKNQTVKVCISTDGGTTYHELNSDWPATISSDIHTFSWYNTINTENNHNFTSNNSQSQTISAAITSELSLSISDINDDFVFVGWFTESKDTLSTEVPYTYEVSGEKTVCAYFRQKPRISLEIKGDTTLFNPSSRITIAPILSCLVHDINYIVCYDTISAPADATTKFVRPNSTSNDVIVQNNDKLGKYIILAKLKEGLDCSGPTVASAVDSFTIKDYVTLEISGSHSVGEKVTLTANTSLSGKYHFTVITPDGDRPISVGGEDSIIYNTREYTLSMPGEYTFYVTMESTVLASDHAKWPAASTKYLRYPFPNSTGSDRVWRNVAMTYDVHSGLYHYYSNVYPISSYESDSYYNHGSTGANILDEDTEDTYGKKYKTIGTNGLSSNMTARIFTYNPAIDSLYLQKADTTKHRIKSVCGNNTYYSNIFTTFGTETAVSFFATFDGTLMWQSSNNTGITWTDGATITLPISKDGVFTATATAPTADGLTNLHEYIGDFKIYGAVTQDTTNVMAQFENITKEEFYNHYWCKWIGTNFEETAATVGNDINHCLADRKVDYKTDSTNIRFAYNPSTNYFSRTFLAASKDPDFLRIYGDNVFHVGSEAADALSNALQFSDGSDWIYSVNIEALANASIIIVAKFKTQTTYVLSEKGLPSDNLNILGSLSGTTNRLPFRIIYDYKTNRVLAVWSPTSETVIDAPITIDADLLISRDSYNSSKPNVVKFSGNGKATILRRIIFELDIDRNTLFNDKPDCSEKYDDASHLFQITLPYETDITNVYGLANYGIDWVIQDYKGEIRAKVGWQGDGVSDFWAPLLWKNGTKLRKGRGYVISTNYDYNDFKTIGSTAKKTLYFASPYKAEGYKLDGNLPDAMVYKNLPCSIKGREPYDSNWRCIGPTSFYPVYAVAENLNYFYRWDGTHNSYTALEAATEPMQPTHNYIVQYSGIIGWTNSPAAPAPARSGILSQSSSARYRLDIKQDSTIYDHAYIHLSPTGTEDYVIGKDLLKIFTSTKPQIYTLMRGVELAANHLPDTTSRVIIGTNLPSSDSCTISLGRATADSLSPILFDALTDTYTNLAETDYTFCGTAGQDEERFTLFFGQIPEQSTATTSTSATTLHACIADGQIIINSDQPLSGTIRLYDAAGRLISAGAASSASAHLPAPTASGIYLIQAGNAATRIIIP